ncbi:complement factor H-like [Diadema antillarum]|uniref:complement factor H-like n=1 Tax=Diadema antillarum TaxID=105358 RepID=UPI003A8566BC
MPKQEGTFFYPTPKQDCYDDGDIIFYQCPGTIYGPPYNECDGGIWLIPFAPTCEVDTCSRPTLDSKGTITPDKPEYNAFESVIFDCDNTFTLVGVASSRCESGGTWNPSAVPSCVECDFKGLPAQGGTYFEPSPKQDCYDSGTRIFYQCTGGTLYGPPHNDCNDGSWTIPFGPTCEADFCVRPTLDDKGTISPNKTQYSAFETVTFGCDNTSSLVGVTTSRCESGGTWNPSTVPSCADDCVAPTLDNGGVSPNQNTFENGDVLVFVCDANYTLVGISTTTCRDGIFDQKTPTCFSKCLPPVVANSDYDTQQDLVDHATTITVECDPGYSTGTGTDTDMTCSNGDFDVPDPVCYENCGVLASTFPNGQRSGNTSPYYHGEVVTYTCDSGHTLVGAAVINCTDGSWSAKEPSCLANCDVGAVPNSDYASGGDVNHGSTFDITCNDGYSTGESRVSSYTCDDGTLTPSELPTCYADCTPPVVPYSDYASQQDTVFHSTSFNITCWSNYSVGPDSQVAALSCDNGNLAGEPVTCYANCPDISPPNDGEIIAGESPFFHEEKAVFQCSNNFTLVGENEITCSNGTWDKDSPVCQAKCQRPVIPDSNSTSSTPLLEHEETILIVCDTGHSNGQSQTSTSTCQNGILTPTPPLCYEDCTPPVVDFSNYASQQPDVYHSTEITIACISGYSTGSRDNTTLTCVDGDFDGTTPVCYANCQPPVVPYSDYNEEEPPVLHLTDVTINCWANYSLGPDSQFVTKTCNNGSLGDDVTCYANCEVPVVPNSDYSNPSDDVFHLVTFNITCDEDYSTGSAVYTELTCNDGDLGSADPTCYANCPDVQIDNGLYTGDSSPFYHEESITFICNTNYTLVGEETVTCNDGNWSSSIPLCLADCLPPIIQNSNYSTSSPSVDHGTPVTITCDTDFSTGTDTTQIITCQDGEFEPAPEECYRDCVTPVVENSDSTEEQSVYHTQPFTITCDTNYTVGDFTPSTMLTCDDGELDDGRNVTCYANCPDPGTPANGARDLTPSDGFYHGTKVTYYCNERFDIIGSPEITCNDGEWSDIMPNCTDKSLYDLIMLTCGPTSMEVEIPLELLGDIGPTDLGLEGNLSCQGFKRGDMMIVNTTLTGCGTNKTENSTHDTYMNQVINNYYDDIVTRVDEVRIPLKCSYERNQEVRAVRYTIYDYVIGKNLEEDGVYSIDFGIYNTSSFNYRYPSDEAIDIDIDRPLYFQLSLDTNVEGDHLVAQDCWGTPDKEETGDVSYQLLEDRCSVDETFEFTVKSGQGASDTDGSSDVNVYFKLNSFRFVSDVDKQVWIHCAVIVCHESSTEDFCQDCATTSRKKRNVALRYNNSRVARSSNLKLEWKHAGPIRFGSAVAVPHFATGEDEQDTAWMNSVIGLGVIIGVFSVILLAVVKHYKRRLRREVKYQQLNTCG